MNLCRTSLSTSNQHATTAFYLCSSIIYYYYSFIHIHIRFVFLLQIITIVCLVLHSKSLESLQEQNDILISGTFLGYTVILIALFAGTDYSNVSFIHFLSIHSIGRRLDGNNASFSNTLLSTEQCTACVGMCVRAISGVCVIV